MGTVPTTVYSREIIKRVTESLAPHLYGNKTRYPKVINIVPPFPITPQTPNPLRVNYINPTPSPSCSTSLNCNLYSIYLENFRTYRYRFNGIDQELVNQFIWYIVCRGQVVLDNTHDFYEPRGGYNPTQFEKYVILSTLFTQNYHEIYYLANKLFGILDNNSFQVLIKSIFPHWNDTSSATAQNPALFSPGNCDWWIYYSFFNVTDPNISVPYGWDIYEASLKINLKCGISRTSVLAQNLQKNIEIVNYFDVPRYIQQNYQGYSATNQISNINPSTQNPIVTCDTTNQQVKFQYTIPFLNSLYNSQKGYYITTLANVWDAGGTSSAFSNYFPNRILHERDNLCYLVHFTFKNTAGHVVYDHNFITFDYEKQGTTNAWLSIHRFSLCDIYSQNINVSQIPDDSSDVTTIGNIMLEKITNQQNSDILFYVPLCASYKFCGDFGKVLGSLRVTQQIATRNILLHGVTDIIGSNISGLFLPGTVFSSFSEAGVADLVDFEFYFKRDFGDVYIQTPYPLSTSSGLRFGSSKKQNEISNVDKDIKYLENVNLKK
jgi:hypothetical protein